jgi:hypothetical protein
MLASLGRFPFSLDPLIAEAKRRARQRRTLIALALLLLAGLAAGLTFAFRSPGGGSPNGGGLTSANYSQLGVSLRYPASWTRLDCTTWLQGNAATPISLLTSAQPAPACPSARTPEFPPPERLGPDGAVVFLSRGIFPASNPNLSLGGRPNASIDGRPAYISPPRFSALYFGASVLASVPCPAGVGREYRTAYVRRPGTANTVFTIAALMCGPHLATADAAVRNLLASMRFANASH